MQVLPAKAKDKEKYVVRYSRGLRNQNGQQLVNLCESNILETQVIFHIYRSQLASRTLFPVKSSIQNKVTHHRVEVGDGCIKGGM